VVVSTSSPSATTPHPQQPLLPNLTPEQRGATGCLPHSQYLRHLRRTREDVVQALDTEAAQQERDYLDHLQRPLQPVGDHLECQTYETFESDPVKYKLYQVAVMHFLRDFSRASRSDADGRTCTVLVVGAGRGPLVTACLAAHRQLFPPRRPPSHHRPACSLAVYAVEKNPGAVAYLRSKLQQSSQEKEDSMEDDDSTVSWKSGGDVTIKIVESDLRKLTLQQTDNNTADLVVSELLGSFGCNELSPECLESLFHETEVCTSSTISIPARYTSHIATASSVQLYNAVRQQALFPNDTETASRGMTAAVETPYVVRPHHASQMHAQQDCWSFVHPARAGSLEGSASLTFGADDPTHAAAAGCGYGPADSAVATACQVLQQQRLQQPLTTTTTTRGWTLTGLLGTFTADLYYSQRTGEMTRLSTAPSHFSVGMFSWFPLYFSLQQPVHVPAGASVKVNLWRKCQTDKVWYEWSVTIFRGDEVLSVTPIHNPGGRSYHMSTHV
jgi:protein arginine N-methyltransferase 5